MTLGKFNLQSNVLSSLKIDDRTISDSAEISVLSRLSGENPVSAAINICRTSAEMSVETSANIIIPSKAYLDNALGLINTDTNGVKFAEDLTLAGNYTLGKAKPTVADYYTISAGTTLQQALKDVFEDIDQSPARTLPAYTFTTSNDNTTHEIGALYASNPKATFKYTNSGTYAYQLSSKHGKTTDTGISVLTNAVAVSCTNNAVVSPARNTATLSVNAQQVFNTTFANPQRYTANDVSYKFTIISAAHTTPSNIPYNNIGLSAKEALPILSTDWATTTLTCQSTYKGVRYYFYGHKTADQDPLPTEIITEDGIQKKRLKFSAAYGGIDEDDAISSDTIRMLSAQGQCGPTVSASYTASKGTTQIVFALPAGKKGTLTATDANSMNSPVSFVKASNALSVYDAAGEKLGTACKYDIWYFLTDATAGASKEMKLNLSWS